MARGGDHKPLRTVKPSANTAVAPPSEPARAYRETIQPLVRKYCVDCHGNDNVNGGVNFESFSDLSSAVASRKTWDKVRKMLETGAMPPAEHPTRPNEAEVATLLRGINQSVFDDDCGKSHDPGHVTIRRLNRAEYNNTIRDLLGVSLRPADEFPSDDVGNGFDNQSDVLSISPLLMERYLTAAERVSSVTLFGVDLKAPPIDRIEIRKLATQGSAQLDRKKYARDKYVWLPSAGSVNGTFRCRMQGEYVLRVIAVARQAGNERPRLEVQIDDQPRQVFQLRGNNAPDRYEVRAQLASGLHKFSAAFTNSLTEPPAPPALPLVATTHAKRKKIFRQRLRANSSWNVSRSKGRSRSTNTTRHSRRSRRANAFCRSRRKLTGRWPRGRIAFSPALRREPSGGRSLGPKSSRTSIWPSPRRRTVRWIASSKRA